MIVARVILVDFLNDIISGKYSKSQITERKKVIDENKRLQKVIYQAEIYQQFSFWFIYFLVEVIRKNKDSLF